MHLCTPKSIYYIKIKINIKTGTSQSTERLQARWGLFSAKFKATANELHQEKTQLRWHDKQLKKHTQYKTMGYITPAMDYYPRNG